MKLFFAKLLGLSKSLLDFYLPILKEILSSGVALLLPIALDIVRDLAVSNKTNVQKREAAVRELKEIAIEQGILATENLIRLTVESAVAKMKAEDQ
jgi:hypothetical protein